MFGGADNVITTEIYEHAKFIITISENTSSCCRLAFPALADRILQASCHVDAKLFSLPEPGKKQRLITYMPRKLAKHSELVTFFLRQNLGKHWALLPIENKSEAEVAELLKTSSIFLSFSDLEGLGLPPLEAALTGNKIIGYTGEGGKEYWKEPMFTEIHSGNIIGYTKKILHEISMFDSGTGYVPDPQLIALLADQYSAKREILSLEQIKIKMSAVFS
ncbi:glycosyltransferase family 4 protein [Prosthecochloris vibrioformis]|uniref:Glycosyltransferase family 4 protein n=1 Tax=Prosthecochloris vibrioformis TaxID=1098 RepID=A0A5C4S1L3_PROVB|nr:glycosyltransferase family 4 protein [Prosthecochloris vibrioformis]